MSNSRKTALLQRFAGVLVEDRGEERAKRLAAKTTGSSIQETSSGSA